ncbi:MAG: ATP-grasp domain-containing protein [Candidatus Micrarchaeota archaeon]
MAENETLAGSHEAAKKKVGFWLPSRKTMTSVTYGTPGALVEEIKNNFVAYLRQNPQLELIEFEDFRKGIISCGRPVMGSGLSKPLDAFVWFGEIGRDFRREYNLELLKTIGQSAKIINSTFGYEIAMDKYLTSTFLAKHGIPVPKFMLVNSENAEAAVEHIKGWGGPVLLKPRLGSYGIGIMKIDRLIDLIDAVDYMAPATHYIEQLIPNDPAQWIGINIIGGEHAYSYRKGPESFHDGWKVLDRKRVGGKMILAQPTDQQLAIAIKIAKLLDMAWVGVDIVTDNSGNPYVVDVNAFPGLYPEMFAKAGIDGPKMMAKAVFSKLGIENGN